MINAAVCNTVVDGYAQWNSTLENNVVVAQCLNGTHPFGNLQRRCLSTGNWSSFTGVCDCTPPWRFGQYMSSSVLTASDREPPPVIPPQTRARKSRAAASTGP